jgi:transcriptional regulator with XRE-family HTH domain
LKETIVISVGNFVKEIRNYFEMNQEEFSVRLNISKTNLCDIETGKTKPGSDFFYKMHRTLNVNLNYLFTGQGEMFLEPTEEKEPLPLRKRFDLEGYFARKPFGEFTQDMKEILWFLERSRLARGAIISSAKKYLFQNRNFIQKDIRSSESKNKKDGTDKAG